MRYACAKYEEMNLVKDTFEPEDWCEFRKLGHKMMDDTIDFLENMAREINHHLADILHLD